MFKFQRHADDLMDFYQKRYKVKQIPKVVFKDDHKNSQNVLGRTGQYDPENKVVTIFVTGRHGKDILRSLAHELIHHLQNERGDLTNIGSTEIGYAQNDKHMRNMEREAYEQGNLCLRDWEDNIKTNNIQLYETIYKTDRIIKGDSVMSIIEKRNKNLHNRLMESWGYKKKNQKSTLLENFGEGSCTPGETFDADDGCNTCECPPSGKKSDAICTKMHCQGKQYSDPDVETLREEEGGKKDCKEDGKTHKHGSKWQSTRFGDDCNTCHCDNGRVSCTKKACGGRTKKPKGSEQAKVEETVRRAIRNILKEII